MTEGFLGRGLAFPLAAENRGGVTLSSAEENIREAIRIILGTAPGERDMRPDFGCGVWGILFDPVDASFEGRVAFLVESALRAWEPRIEVEKVAADLPAPNEVRQAGAGETKVVVNIEYRVRVTNRADNLVFPFYRNAAA